MRRRLRPVLLCALGCATLPVLHAQSSAQPVPDSTSPQSAPAAADDSSASSCPAPAEVRNDQTPSCFLDRAATSWAGSSTAPTRVAALDGTGLIATGGRLPNRYLLTLGAGSGYDSELLNQKGLSSAVYSGNAIGSGLWDKRRFHAVLQDALSLAAYSAKSPDGSHAKDVLNRFSLGADGQLTDRLSVTATSFASYGSDALRTVATPQSVPVGTITAPVSGVSSYGLQTGDILIAQTAGTLGYRTSERGSLTFSVANSYLRYFDISAITKTTVARADFIHLRSRALTLGVYGMGTHQSGTLTCSSGGGGVEMRYHPSLRLEVGGNTGVLTGNSECGRAAQLVADGSIFLHFTPRTAVYATGGRWPNNGVLPRAIWISSGTGGIRHLFGRGIEGSFDYTASLGTVTSGNKSYRESYAGGSLTVPLGRNFSQELLYRHFAQEGLDISPNRNVAQVTLWWNARSGSPRSR